jgi:hypothetical protein
MKLIKLYKVLLFVLIDIASFIPLATIVLGYYDGSGGGHNIITYNAN